MKTCKKCGAENPSAAVFCGKCGARLGTGKGLFSKILTIAVIVVMSAAFMACLAFSILHSVYDEEALKYYESLPTPLEDLPPDNEAVNIDGKNCRKITIHAPDGCTVYIDSPGIAELKKTAENGKAEFIIEEDEWIEEAPSKYVKYSIVNMSARVEDGDKVIKNIVFPEFAVEIPETRIILPDNGGKADISTTLPTYALNLIVPEGGTISLNGVDMSERIKPDGRVCLYLDAVPGHKSLYTIEAVGYKRRPYSMDVSINRPDTAFTLNFSNKLPYSTESAIFPVSGKCEPYSNVSINMPTYVDLNADMYAGAFDCEVQLQTLGQNIIEVSAELNGKVERVSHTVYYMPPEEEYIKMARTPSYSALKMNPASFIGRIYLCKGTVDAVESTTSGKYLLVNIGSSEKKELVYIRYVHEGTPSEGDAITVYADMAGDYNGYPLLYGRYLGE